MFVVIDTKLDKIIARRSQYEAHRMVDFLNSSGIVRYKARAA